ncbi:hypothetical protein F443_09120 [Phytophthora nicotianae P1569]|uniref:Uncharacterized protein n=1 Tax=Phytophthora nicotianae P1569 TaxID=1317065 RepID=V9F5Y4_PHYNI|nr:hypothetical protein F443_09120 [Phytophthora nicotianae P1569]
MEVGESTINVVYDLWDGCLSEVHDRELFIDWIKFAVQLEECVSPARISCTWLENEICWSEVDAEDANPSTELGYEGLSYLASHELYGAKFAAFYLATGLSRSRTRWPSFSLVTKAATRISVTFEFNQVGDRFTVGRPMI